MAEIHVNFQNRHPNEVVSFDRRELNLILNAYGRFVSSGILRDYAMNFEKDEASFSFYRHTADAPLYSLHKIPSLRRRQGQFQLKGQNRAILTRNDDLRLVLAHLEQKMLKRMNANGV